MPLLPIALWQAAVCFVTAFFLGLEVTVNVLWSVLMIIPASVFFIALGLLCGSALSVKQVGGHMRRAADKPHRMAVRHMV